MANAYSPVIRLPGKAAITYRAILRNGQSAHNEIRRREAWSAQALVVPV